MRLALALSASVLFAAGPALSKEMAPGAPPLLGPAVAESPAATAAELATAGAEADRLIAAAGAGDVFENITGDARPTVLHRASGLVCVFEPGNPGNLVQIFASPLPRGEDVGCNIPSDGYSVTHYATRYTDEVTAEIAVHDAVASVRERFGSVAEYGGDRLQFGSENLPRTYLAPMQVSYEGRSFYTHAATAELNGWIFKQRLTAPIEDATQAQIIGAAAWIGMLTFAQHRPFDTID